MVLRQKYLAVCRHDVVLFLPRSVNLCTLQSTLNQFTLYFVAVPATT
jgi:hypothetical protein